MTIGSLNVDAGVSVTVKGVTITGRGQTGPENVSGVENAGSLTLKSSVVTGNQTSFGAGIFNQGTGTVTLQDSTVSDNLGGFGGGGGGGIYNAVTGTTTLRNSTVSGNAVPASPGAGEGIGGGISNHGALRLRESTVSGNDATDRGGGIHNSATGTAALFSSAVIDNTAPVDPGIFNDGGTLTIRDSTIQP
jgi:hypothetical protein